MGLGVLVVALGAPVLTYGFWIWTPGTGFVQPGEAILGTAKAQFNHAKSLFEAKEYTRAYTEFKKVVENFPNMPNYRKAAQFRAIQSIFLAGDLYKAYEECEFMLEKLPETKRVSEILKLEYDIGLRFCTGATRSILYMIPISGGPTGVRILRRVIEHDPYSDLAELSLLRIGEYYATVHRYEDAVGALKQLRDDYPRSPYRARALELLAKCKLAQVRPTGDYDRDAAIEAKKAIREAATADLSDEARTRLNAQARRTSMIEAHADYDTARFYLKQGKTQAALIYLHAVVREHPETPYAAICERMLKSLEPLAKETR